MSEYLQLKQSPSGHSWFFFYFDQSWPRLGSPQELAKIESNLVVSKHKPEVGWQGRYPDESLVWMNGTRSLISPDSIYPVMSLSMILIMSCRFQHLVSCWNFRKLSPDRKERTGLCMFTVSFTERPQCLIYRNSNVFWVDESKNAEIRQLLFWN